MVMVSFQQKEFAPNGEQSSSRWSAFNRKNLLLMENKALLDGHPTKQKIAPNGEQNPSRESTLNRKIASMENKAVLDGQLSTERICS